ncbi:rhomboid family intramembrane serine protease [Bowmanella pacifica]|uniref:Rhomboid family intramembrane serine protease n=1 Tax=Bowmanella pacifica TaxID=502051 RepID=A0A918DHL4_9ALTE|nr:rhomboid family intramembrane serine protease [Bowmanella pacifica]GGO67091.1 rhomboid family intramembrane serine protease [Bowmanella pacifica]
MLKNQLKVLLWLLASFAIVEVINFFSGRALNQLGILPREVTSLPGILFMPWLHGSLAHFMSNIVPLAIFWLLMLEYGLKRTLWVSLFIILSTGMLVWLFGRFAYHIGASGLVYGQFGFLVLAGFYSRQVIKLIISLAVGFLYGGMVFGVLPSQPFISWEAHLFGFASGLLAARLWHGRPKIPNKG